MPRKASFTLLLVALAPVVSAAAASNALAQDSGVDQYLESPAPAPDEGGGGGGTGGGETGGGGSGGTETGGGGSGGGGTGGGSQPAPSAPSGGSGDSGGAASKPQEPASDASSTSRDRSGSGEKPGDTKATAEKQGDQKQQRTSNDKGDNGYKGSANTGLEEVGGSTVSDSGSSGIGIVLPIILGAVLLAAIAFVVVRRRRHKTAHA
jgi:cobalamin biosynthesis Mg chelatase CobN